MSEATRTLYEVLGLQQTASVEQIKQRFRALAREHHPDVATEPEAAEKFVAISKAYRTLADPRQKAAYDASLSLAGLRVFASDGAASARAPQGRRAAPPREVLNNMLEQAETAIRVKWFRQAEILCLQVLHADSTLVHAYELLGEARLGTGQTENALGVFEHALRLDPRNGRLRSRIDQLTSAKPSPSRAVRKSRKAVASAPTGDRGAMGLLSRLACGTLGAWALLSLLSAVRQNPQAGLASILVYTAAAAAISGAALALGGVFAASRQALGFTAARRSRPVGPALMGLSVLSFYAAALYYGAQCVRGRAISSSLLLALAVSFGIVGLFAFMVDAEKARVLLLGGNVAFLALVAGWSVADRLRTPA